MGAYLGSERRTRHVRVHRVFLKGLQAGERVLSGVEAHHLAQVLRVKPGAKVKAFDGLGLEAAGEVQEVDELSVTLRLESPKPSDVEAALKLTLAVPLLKGDKFSEVVRRGTELGAVRFIPLVASRCDVKVLSENKLTRYRRVAKEAAKQSGRSVVPEVEPLRKLAELDLGPLTLVAHTRSSATLQEVMGPDTQSDTEGIMLVTGPEGGLSEQEVEFLVEQGARGVNLGARILRAETAPVALTAALLLPEAL